MPRVAVFLFPGQGAQYAGMGRDLYEHEPRFRAVIDECAERLTAALGLDIRDLMFGTHPDANARLRRTSIAQPALFVFELALARLWQAAGVTPSACVGHSIGEYVAACLAGVLSLDDALALVAERGRLMERTAPGTMLAVALPGETLLPMLDGLALAAANGPALSVASGSVEAIARLEAQLAEQQIETWRLHTSHAFHSDLMDPALAEFRDAVARTERHAPTIPFASNVTGGWNRAGRGT